MILPLFSQKGGNGKTLLTACLSVELMLRKYRVCVVDTDPQGSTMIWRDLASDNHTLTPHVVGVGGKDDIIDALLALKPNYDFVIVDTEGGVSQRSAAALAVADFAVLPCLPAPQDLNSLPDTIQAVRLAQEARPELQARILVNCMYNTILAKQYRKGIAAESFPMFTTELWHRTPYKESWGKGKGITNYKPKCEASKELKQLVDELLGYTSDLAHVA